MNWDNNNDLKIDHVNEIAHKMTNIYLMRISPESNFTVKVSDEPQTDINHQNIEMSAVKEAAEVLFPIKESRKKKMTPL